MKKKLKGFTLIELLVSVGIMAIVVGIGLTSIGSFGNEKQVVEEANKLAADLRWARAGAQNGLHADQCALGVEYDGIRVTVTGGRYTMAVECEGIVVKKWVKFFGSGVISSPVVPATGDVIFKPVDQGIDASQNFLLYKNGINYRISVVGGVQGEATIKVRKL